MDNNDWSANPFQDPSVQGAAGATRAVTTISSGVTATDEYNPFAPTPPIARPAPRPPQPPNQATATAPASSTRQSTAPSFSALADREAELAGKEEELRRRQLDLEQREAEISRRSGKFQVPNWPPFPQWMPPPFKPWIFHSIQTDIPSENQGTMIHMFGLWYFHCFCYVVNVIAAIAGTACESCSGTGTNLAIAIVFLCVGIPGAFKMWYRILYNGLKKDRAVNFMIFFFVFGFQVLADIYFCLGFQSTGACGWVSAGVAWQDHAIIGIFYVISALAWSVSVGGSVYMIVRVHRWYRGTDYTFDRAQGELAAQAAQSRTVQQAVIRTALP